MRIIVQKFGGTSVVTPEARARVVERVKAALADEYEVVVVVSAMGRLGDPYATDTLIRLAKSILPDTEPRNLDLLMSCGETISSVVMGNTLQAEGVKTAVLTAAQAGIITDDQYGNAEVIRVNSHRLTEHLELGYVVVVPGFQGVTEHHDITTLGRGGSDTTASIIGAAVGASMIEIYTDVDGVKTADPRIVPGAKTIDVMTFEEVYQLAYEGAKVIHPRAVEIAMQHKIPLKVRSTFDDLPGTLVTSPLRPDAWSRSRHVRPVTGVAYLTDLVRFFVKTGGSGIKYVAVFSELAEISISVDMISLTQDFTSFVVKREQEAKVRASLAKLGVAPEDMTTTECAKVTLVGAGMKGMPGVMAATAEALYQGGIRVLQTADSSMSISCLVDRDDLQKAVRVLHDKFRLNGTLKPEVERGSPYSTS